MKYIILILFLIGCGTTQGKPLTTICNQQEIVIGDTEKSAEILIFDIEVHYSCYTEIENGWIRK